MIKAQFRHWAELIDDPMLLVNGTGIVIEMNSQAPQLFQRPRREMLGRRLHDFVTAGTVPIDDYLALCARTSEYLPGALIVVRGAEQVPCRADGAAGHGDGTGTRCIILRLRTKSDAGRSFEILNHTHQIERLGYEIDLRKAAQAALQEVHAQLETRVRERTADLERANAELRALTDNLKAANAELEQFSYITSHDLQEPIRMVSMFMQRLTQGGPHLSAEQREQYMRYVEEGAERMRLLIEDLLRYNSIERDRDGRILIDSESAVRGALDNLTQLITASRVKVIIAGAFPHVVANPQQLMQVFQNLIQNAIKYGPDRDSRIEVVARPLDEAWQFSVRDNGIGIEPQYYEKIFAVFQRLHGRDQYSGTGMGLAICKKVVERHGGRIWVDSVPGVGSTFHFTVPKV
ncbi:MAG: PAS domain-containing protein [Planctomycetes bacterium]|nr:PAS domain-containing protein [Planctomycetota bacterium]